MNPELDEAKNEGVTPVQSTTEGSKTMIVETVVVATVVGAFLFRGWYGW